MEEIWKPIPGYEGLYEVSNIGNVRGVDRFVKNSPGYPMRLLKSKQLIHRIDKINRKSVDLYENRNRKTFYVHALVLAAFVGPRPEKMDCCHNDGNPRNNHVDNLRYDTRSGNFKDKLLHGTHNRGENSPVSKLTEPQVIEIRRRAATGESHNSIAADFPVNRRHMSDIIRRLYWFHI